MTTECDTQQRRSSYGVLKPCFEAIRWIGENALQSEDATRAVALLSELSQQLANKPILDAVVEHGPIECPCCREALIEVGQYVPGGMTEYGYYQAPCPRRAYCAHCMATVEPAVRAIEAAFSFDAI